MAACGVLLGGLLLSTNANATVTYRDSASVQFTFAPMLSVSLSADGFTINDLVPGTSSISNAVTATVITNSNHGYQLSATVGNSTYTSSDLVSSTGNKRFSMISSGTSLTSGTWGYTLDSGTTYGGLNTYIPTVLKTTAGPTGDLGDATPMQIGAYAASDQKPDVYNNVVNFVVLSNVEAPMPSQLYLQDITSDMCTTDPLIAYDSRDGQEYTIQRVIDGNCWMLDNLRLGSDTAIKLTPDDTNIASDWWLPASSGVIGVNNKNGWDSNATAKVTTAHSDEINPDSSLNYGVGSHKYGAHYNFCAASGGTVCGDSGLSSATYDICPKGWRMPTGLSSSFDEYGNINSIAVSNEQDIKAVLSLSLAGDYDDILAPTPDYIHNQGSRGYYWSSTIETSSAATGLSASPGYTTLYLAFTSVTKSGRSVRCLLK